MANGYSNIKQYQLRICDSVPFFLGLSQNAFNYLLAVLFPLYHDDFARLRPNRACQLEQLGADGDTMSRGEIVEQFRRCWNKLG
jgi:hypothetical protein